jgi:hypothetical protein
MGLGHVLRICNDVVEGWIRCTPHLRGRHLLANRHSKERELEQVDFVSEAGNEILIELHEKAVLLELRPLNALLQLHCELVPELAVVQFPQVCKCSRQLRTLRCRPLNPNLVAVRHERSITHRTRSCC